MTGQLEHPGIVPVHQLGVDAQGRLFYAMKLVRGTTLGEIIKRLQAGEPVAVAKYPLGTLLTIFLKVCDAVAFAHSRGVLHRDLKPENVMVGEYGEVLVMDWGLAKVVGAEKGEARPVPTGSGRLGPASPALTLDGQILGTPAYMAPEQARGEIGSLDGRTDVYSLGAILYTLLVLRHRSGHRWLRRSWPSRSGSPSPWSNGRKAVQAEQAEAAQRRQPDASTGLGPEHGAAVSRREGSGYGASRFPDGTRLATGYLNRTVALWMRPLVPCC